MQALASAGCKLVIACQMQQTACEVGRLLFQRQLPARQGTEYTGRAGYGLPQSYGQAKCTPGVVSSSHSHKDAAGLHARPELTWMPGVLRQGSKLRSAPPLCAPAAPGPAIRPAQSAMLCSECGSPQFDGRAAQPATLCNDHAQAVYA